MLLCYPQTVCEGFLLGVVASRYNTNTVLMAAGICAVSTKRNTSFVHLFIYSFIHSATHSSHYFTITVQFLQLKFYTCFNLGGCPGPDYLRFSNQDRFHYVQRISFRCADYSNVLRIRHDFLARPRKSTVEPIDPKNIRTSTIL